MLFQPKKYIIIPNIKTKYIDKEKYTNLNISYLKSRQINAEALINEAYLLGFSKGPEKEYEELLQNNKDFEVIKFEKIHYEVIFYI